MKEDPAKGWLGAVVLQDRLIFRNTHIEYVYRVRILGESGRRAAEIGTLPEQAYEIEGRTVYPDGHSISFNKLKDMTSKSITVGGSDEKRTVLIPPGVTSDCVVEIRWMERRSNARSPLPRRMGWSHRFPLANAFPTLESIVEVPNTFPFAHSAFPTRTQKPEVSESHSYRIYTFRNLPAKKPIPYGLEVTREFPAFVAYFIPDRLRGPAGKGGDVFWKEASLLFYKGWFIEDVEKGNAYKTFSADIRSGLKGNAIEQASALMTRLDARIRNRSYATYQERAAETKNQAEEGIKSHDLDAAVKRGETSASGMTLLYLHLLMDQGLHPKIALVADRDRQLFIYDFPNVFQFTSELIVIEDPEKGALWVEPSRRFLTPGVVHQDFQGTPALMLDPKTWTSARTTIAAQSPKLNVRRYLVDLFPEEGSDRFKIDASFSGFPEFLERQRFRVLEPKEQVRTLKESLERGTKSATFARLDVKGAQSADTLLSWTAEGQIEREESRTRSVYPFPCVPWALHIPDEWPADRTDPIVMPYLRVQQSLSTVHLPEGWTWSGLEDFKRENRFGSVSWVAKDQGDGTVKVMLQVEVASLFEPATAYEDLKTFLGWLKEASGRTLILRRK